MAELNKLSIKFNEDKFHTDLCEKLFRAVMDVAISLALEMKHRTDDKKVAESITYKYDKNFYAKMLVYNLGVYSIEVKVGSPMWRAFIDNYGYGSEMNIARNPFFDQYLNSEYWNPLRDDKTIVGREKGWYKTLDWDTANPVKEVHRYSEGKYAGENIEGLTATMPNGKQLRLFNPKKGSYFMEYSFRAMRDSFEDEINKVISSMDITKYITTGK